MDSGTIARQLADYDTKRVTSADALNEALKQYGVPEIRNTVSGLRTTVANTTNALNSVDPSVTGRTSGSLVTEAQRQRQVVNERAPIAEQLGTQTGALGTQEQILRDSLEQASTQATNRVNDWNTGRAALQSQYDTTYKREQDAAAAARAAAEAAESRRQFDMQLAASSAANAAKGGGKALSAKETAAQTKAALADHITASLGKMIGKDGKVGTNTWGSALRDWQVAGGTTREFWQRYGSFVNRSHIKSYAGYAQR